MQEVSSEISYQLPKEESDHFKKFFAEFDQNLDALGIRSYGVGVTTLEEVFLKIGHGEEEQTRMIDNTAHNTTNMETDNGPETDRQLIGGNNGVH